MALAVSRTNEEAPMRVARPYPRAVALIFIDGDLIATIAAGLLSYWLRTRVGPLSFDLYWRLAPLLLLVPLAFLNFGLYPGYGLGPVEQLGRSSRAVTLVFLILLSLTFILKAGTTASRVVVFGWWLLSLLFIPLVRALLRQWLVKASWWGKPLVVLGAARTGEVVIRRLAANPSLGLRPVACLDDDPAKLGKLCASIPVVGPLRLASELARHYPISMAVVAMPGLGRERLTRVVEEHAALFREILLVPDLLGLTSLWVSARDLQGVLGLELSQNLLSRWNRFVKRSLDLAVSVPALLVIGPIILLLGLLVKLFSPGPAFYGQEREGEGGRRIRIWKLRTMVPDAEQVLEKFLATNPQGRAEWDRHMKLKDDPRIVPQVGHLLRRLSLDELPQLWNIFRGDMSLVGPRPFPEYHLNRFSPAFRELRRKVPPGLTGLWQVSARSEGDLAVQEELDTYYIRNWSLGLDVYLLARTITAVLFGNGAY